MRDTGIIRRIDELGRVVIPKEIRKTLRIREGDALEIYTDKEQLLFKKYSPLATLTANGEIMLKCLYSLIEQPCILVDNDSVLFVAGIKGEFIGKTLSQGVEKVLKDRKTISLSTADGDSILQIFKGDETGAENQIISPIISNGDCFGGIIVFNKDTGSKFTPSEIKLCTLATQFLGKQFE